MQIANGTQITILCVCVCVCVALSFLLEIDLRIHMLRIDNLYKVVSPRGIKIWIPITMGLPHAPLEILSLGTYVCCNSDLFLEVLRR